MPLGQLFAIRAVARDPAGPKALRRNIPWLAGAGIAVGSFAFMIARGIGVLA